MKPTNSSDIKSDDKLQNERDLITRIDDKIVALLDERFDCSLRIGKIKRDLGVTIQSPMRERDVLLFVGKKSKYGSMVKTVYKSILDQSKKVQ